MGDTADGSSSFNLFRLNCWISVVFSALPQQLLNGRFTRASNMSVKEDCRIFRGFILKGNPC